jgi:hypothetical protein
VGRWVVNGKNPIRGESRDQEEQGRRRVLWSDRASGHQDHI